MFQYEALVTKCRCMMSSMLSKQDYSELMSCRSVADAASYLAKTPAYSGILAGEDLTRIHRNRLEYLLESDLLDTYLKLYRFSCGTMRLFFARLISDFEIYYLMAEIANVSAQSVMSDLIIPPRLREHSKIDFAAITSATSMSDILAATANSEYYAVLKPFLSSSGQIDCAEIETALYNNYYGKMWKKFAPMLQKDEAEQLRHVIGVKADLTNISRIIRLKRFARGMGNDSPDYDMIERYLIKFRSRLGRDDIDAMLELDSTEEIIAYIGKVYPGHSDLSEAESANGDYFSVFMSAYSKRLSNSAKPSLLIPYGYLNLKEYEIDNIIYIIEAIRYGIPVSDIEKNII